MLPHRLTSQQIKTVGIDIKPPLLRRLNEIAPQCAPRA